MNKIILALIVGIIAFTFIPTAKATHTDNKSNTNNKKKSVAFAMGIGSLYGTGIQPGSIFIEGVISNYNIGGGMHTDFRTYGSAYFIGNIRGKTQWSFPITTGIGFTQENIVHYIGASRGIGQPFSSTTGDRYENKDTIGFLWDAGFGISYTFKGGFFFSARTFLGMAIFNTTREAVSLDDAIKNDSNNLSNDGCRISGSGCEIDDSLVKTYGGTYLMLGYEF